MNFVVIVGDDIGVDWAPLRGCTPNLDARAATGVRFPKHSAYPTCSPCRTALLTGRSAYRNGVGLYLGQTSFNRVGLDPMMPNLPRQLGAAGYRTAAIGKWHLASTSLFPNEAQHPIAAGFDSWEGIISNLPTGESYSNFSWWNGATNSSNSISPSYLTTYTADRAIAQITGTEPFFLYVCFNAPHAPYHCPPSSLHSLGASCGAGTTVENYRAMTMALDTEMERFVSKLDLSDTTVIFIGDNGTPEELLQGYSPGTVGDLHGKFSLRLGGIRTPHVVFGAAVTGTGVCRSLTQATDHSATILDLSGANPLDGDGISYAAQLANPNARASRHFSYSEIFIPNGLPVAPTEHSRSAEDRRYHLIRLNTGVELMFDAESDPYELTPLDLNNLSTTQRQSYDDLRWVINTNGSIHRTQGMKRVRVRTKRVGV